MGRTYNNGPDIAQEHLGEGPRLFYACIDCFTMSKLGATEVGTPAALLVSWLTYNFYTHERLSREAADQIKYKQSIKTQNKITYDK